MGRAAALAAAVVTVLLGGCGDDDEAGPTARDQLRPPPAGYRYAPAPNPTTEQVFRVKVKRDLDADDVELRSVYEGKAFVAGIVMARTRRPVSVEQVAEKVTPGGSGPEPATIGGKPAWEVVGPRDDAVIDRFGPFVLVVVAHSPATAKRLAAPLVR